MCRSSTSRVLAIVSAAVAVAGCGRKQQPPEPTPVAVRIDALLPLHPAWHDLQSLQSAGTARAQDMTMPAAVSAQPLAPMPRRMVYEVPPAPAAPAEPVASDARIEELRAGYDRRNAKLSVSEIRQKVRQMEAAHGPISLDIARSDALADALYQSQYGVLVAPDRAKALAIQSQINAFGTDKRIAADLHRQLDAVNKRADEAEARLRVGLVERKSQGVQKVLDEREHERDRISQELQMLEAERNAEVGKQLAEYKAAVARSKQIIKPLTETVVPRPVVSTPAELREPPQPLANSAVLRPPAPRDSSEAARILLAIMVRDMERRVDRAAAVRGWKPVYAANASLPDKTDALRQILLAN